MNDQERKYATIIAKAAYEEYVSGDESPIPWDDLASSFKGDQIAGALAAAKTIISQITEDVNAAYSNGYHDGYADASTPW